MEYAVKVLFSTVDQRDNNSDVKYKLIIRYCNAVLQLQI